MTIKYIDLIKSVDAMKCLNEKDSIPFLTAFSISKNISSIDNALCNYLSSKNKITDKYADEKNSVIKQGFEEIYLKELTQLNEKEIDIEIIKINSKDLSSLTFRPKYIECISFMLE